MKKNVVSSGKSVIEYYSFGDDPKLLITSGVHGDEFEVVDSVRIAINRYHERLPSFVYIPVVSPSGYAAKTRLNAEGLDPNRTIFEGTTSDEGQLVVGMVKDYKFDLYIDFHEDSTFHDFYLYDTPPILKPEKKEQLLSEIEKLGVGLFSGIDDPDDPVLANRVVGGYTNFSLENDDHSLESWMRFSKRVKETIVPEVPGLVSIEIKNQIVDAIFRHLIL